MTLRSQLRDARPGPQNPPITVEAEVVEIIDERTCLARVPNGKEVHAHFPKRAREPRTLRPGDTLLLEFNPYDFSRARIRS